MSEIEVSLNVTNIIQLASLCVGIFFLTGYLIGYCNNNK